MPPKKATKSKKKVKKQNPAGSREKTIDRSYLYKWLKPSRRIGSGGVKKIKGIGSIDPMAKIRAIATTTQNIIATIENPTCTQHF